MAVSTWASVGQVAVVAAAAVAAVLLPAVELLAGGVVAEELGPAAVLLLLLLLPAPPQPAKTEPQIAAAIAAAIHFGLLGSCRAVMMVPRLSLSSPASSPALG